MFIAVIAGLAAAAIGWFRASKRGGTASDCLQYAVSHGIPVFLLTLILLVTAGKMGWLGAQ